ncbi:MAG: dihydroorotase [Chitinophagia bacterium]|nr:dihydroorotase [Chitinophagia bacterium]
MDDNPGRNEELVDIHLHNGIISEITAATDVTTGVAILLDGAPHHKGYHPEAGAVKVSTGWVDVFADYREPGQEHKETIATGLAAAAAGGFTDVFVVPGTEPPVTNRQALAFLQDRARGANTTLHVLGGISQRLEGKEMAELMDMHHGGAIAFTDGWKPLQHAGLMQKALEYVTAFNGTIIQIPVETALATGGLMNEGQLSTRLGMPGIQPLAETLLLYRDLELARYTGSKLHVTGVSLAESIAMIARAKADGVQVTCSVTPYHLALTEEILTTYNSQYKVTPPLRTEADRQALIAGIQTGVIDCIASHHRPHDWDAKEKEFEYAADGMAIQEHAFSIVCHALQGVVPATTLARLMGGTARTIFGLPNNGVQVGAPALLTVFDTDVVHPTGTTQQSLGYNNPFLHQTLRGRVLGMVNGTHYHFN